MFTGLPGGQKELLAMKDRKGRWAERRALVLLKTFVLKRVSIVL